MKYQGILHLILEIRINPPSHLSCFKYVFLSDKLERKHYPEIFSFLLYFMVASFLYYSI